jgi:formate hydrogenlyase subunit 3/multisubunit Na+/H+ antiporter MnhD subunit
MPVLFSDMVYNIQDSPILLTLCILGGLISLGAIFLYNNRGLQLKLSYVSTVLSILLPLVAVLLVYNEGTTSTQVDKINDGIGIYLPIAGLIFSLLAARYIRKDENIVRSMDRLR